MKSFRGHMLVHLPDVSCEICGEEVPAESFTKHWNHCGLETEREIVEDLSEKKEDLTRHSDSCPMKIYWEETPSESSNILGIGGGHRTRRGRCLLCEKIIHSATTAEELRSATTADKLYSATIAD